MPSIRYVYEKLWAAMSSLIGKGPIQDRLFSASLNLVRLEPEDFPVSPYSDVDLRGTFRKTIDALSKVEPKGDEGSLRATMNAMNDEEAIDLANNIFWLFTEVAELDAPGNQLPQPSAAPRQRVPETWIGQMVIVDFDSQDKGDYTRSGWLRGVNDDGIEFAKAFYSDSLKRQMPERTQFYPWAFIRAVRLSDND